MAQEIIATLGTFDGVHLGHQHLLSRLNTLAKQRGMEAAVFTFYPHPAQVLRPDAVPSLLSSQRERIERLKEQIANVHTLVFSRDLSNLSAEEFIYYLKNEYGVRGLLLGYDHRFGRGAQHSFEEYRAMGIRCGVEVWQEDCYLTPDGLPISSSRIRQLLLENRVEAANSLLGYPYEVTGHVMGGMRIGRAMGYPTANIAPEEATKLIPADGVYAVSVLNGGNLHYGMLYIGKRPTIDNGGYRTIEVNIFDLNADLYTKSLTLRLEAFVRADCKFASIEELKAQIAHDEVAIRQHFRNQGRL
ncbi:MAG: riboflavin biosynthesis protein RibF [Porphyromonadaceae bacterium]|nr:riboflavin biosynthesis protein RibF [Porphyromonadaceae bacterium]